MDIHFIRNATLIIEHAGHRVLVDPMIGAQGAYPSAAFFRHPPKRNPTVPLPENARAAIEQSNHALITHCQWGHFDHLDKAGEAFLRENELSTYCRSDDEKYLRKKGLVVTPLEVGKRQPFLSGHITPVPTVHGYGWIAKLKGPGVGYFIELADAPSVYVSGDTVLTDHVREILVNQKPDIAIVAAGGASADIGSPILMTIEDVLEFVRLAPGRVCANHMEAVNHCPVTRDQLRKAANFAGLGDKLIIPADGEIVQF